MFSNRLMAVSIVAIRQSQSIWRHRSDVWDYELTRSTAARFLAESGLDGSPNSTDLLSDPQTDELRSGIIDFVQSNHQNSTFRSIPYLFALLFLRDLRLLCPVLTSALRLRNIQPGDGRARNLPFSHLLLLIGQVGRIVISPSVSIPTVSHLVDSIDAG